MKYKTSTDPHTRSDHGIAVTISPDEDGKTKLILDDVRSQFRVGEGHGWEQQALFTSAEFDTNELEALDLDREKLADFAENLIIRLLVLNQRNLKDRAQ
jgi:hypothetical protein